MPNKILTPITVWRDFNIEEVPTAEKIGEFKKGNIVLSRVRINGRTCEDGQVKIYAVLARNVKKEKLPAIMVFQKFYDAANENLAIELAKNGYAAMVVDLSGEDGVNNNHTEYPKSLSYANYCVAKDKFMQVTEGVTNTCWYEWGVTARYALKYLKHLPFVGKVGGLGICDAATVLWHIAGTTTEFDCVAFAMNAGWRGYKGKYKFSGVVDEQFTDEQIKYFAGIEPQSYASLIKCPSMIAVATNSGEYDFDRTHDSFARINNEYYKAIHYSVGNIDCVCQQGFESIIQFFNEFLPKTKKTLGLPKPTTIKCELVDKKMQVKVTADKNKIKDVCIYCAEEELAPNLRAWQKVSEYTLEDGVYTFEYLPYSKSKVVFFFAVATYKNGFSTGSDVISKKFEPEEVDSSYPQRIIYSSREENSISAFYPAGDNDRKPDGLILDKESKVEELKGAMDIYGATCRSGLLTFKIGTEKFNPQSDAMLLMDVYMKESGNVTVKFILDFFGEKREFFAVAKVVGGEVWHNLKFTLNQFKSKEGMGLRSLDKIHAIEIDADTEYLINNMLWV